MRRILVTNNKAEVTSDRHIAPDQYVIVHNESIVGLKNDFDSVE
jgi:hypothetical protein